MSAIRLSLLRGGEHSAMAVDFDPARANLYLLGPDDAILGAADERTRRAHFPGAKAQFSASARASLATVSSRDEALTRGAQLVTRGERSSEERLRSQARASLNASLKRLTRKAAAIREDLARAETAPLMRREANLLLCHLAAVSPGSEEVALEDLSSEPVETLRIKLDPSLSAQQNAERRFARARRMERGATIAATRLRDVESELSSLSHFAETSAALDAASLIHEASLVGIKLDAGVAQAKPRAAKARQEHIPYRSFQGEAGARILVGKGAADNDALTLTIARPHDLWLHARGLQGAHVIIPRERNAAIAPELLLDAAHLAVHFSSARGEASAEVQYAERRYLRKPKGSAPGAVRVDRERVLLLRVEQARLERLLANENKP
jgi:predicted ribosome quality control (RQC) complex YloA/Tae2 family protein